MLISYHEIRETIVNNNIKINGILHVGAHNCEEIHFYINSLNTVPENMVWIDGIAEKVNENRSRGIPNVYHALITDKDDEEIDFNISSNVESSSIFEFGTHSIDHPNIHFVNTIRQKSITINSFFERNNIDGSKCNFWNLDIQGAELLALKGATKYIQYVDALLIEVNSQEVYKNCGLITDIDEFLSQYNFERVVTAMTPAGWGDAIYVKKKI